MTVTVTLQLPENMVAYAKRFGEATQRDIGQVFTDTLEMMWVTLDVDGLDLSVTTLSDDDVLKLATIKMDPVQNERLGYLQRKGKTADLIEAERAELLFLLQLYQVGQLHKSQAMAEASRRDLSEKTWQCVRERAHNRCEYCLSHLALALNSPVLIHLLNTQSPTPAPNPNPHHPTLNPHPTPQRLLPCARDYNKNGRHRSDRLFGLRS